MNIDRIKEIGKQHHLTMSKNLIAAMVQAAYEEGQEMKDLYLAVLHKWEVPIDEVTRLNRGQNNEHL